MEGLALATDFELQWARKDVEGSCRPGAGCLWGVERAGGNVHQNEIEAAVGNGGVEGSREGFFAGAAPAVGGKLAGDGEHV